MAKGKDTFDVMMGIAIAKIRESMNLSQRDFAKKIGIPRSTIATWEVGSSSIPMKQYIKVCNTLCVDYGTLMEKVYNQAKALDSRDSK